jgi:hypothetical protein
MKIKEILSVLEEMAPSLMLKILTTLVSWSETPTQKLQEFGLPMR